MSDNYVGMTFFYGEKDDLDEKTIEAVKIMMKMGFKWIKEVLVGDGRCESGFTVEKVGGGYIMKEYGADEIRKLVYYSGAEWFAKVEPKGEREMGEEELEGVIRKYGVNMPIHLYVVPFPPLRYYKKHGIKYDKNRPFHPTELVTAEEGNVVDVYKYEVWKRAVILDFWSLHDYFHYTHSSLKDAVGEFVLDLMREVVKGTKPVYGYVHLDEWLPLEYDPMCDNMREFRRSILGITDERKKRALTRMGVRLGNICYIPKEVVDSSVVGDVRWVYRAFKEEYEEIEVEDFGTHYLLYPKIWRGYIRYFIRDSEWEVEVFSRLIKETKVAIEYVCGNRKDGYVVWVYISGRDREDELKKLDERKEEYMKRLNSAGAKYGVQIRDIRLK